jgi:hypothetical protein
LKNVLEQNARGARFEIDRRRYRARSLWQAGSVILAALLCIGGAVIGALIAAPG